MDVLSKNSPINGSSLFKRRREFLRRLTVTRIAVSLLPNAVPLREDDPYSQPFEKQAVRKAEFDPRTEDPYLYYGQPNAHKDRDDASDNGA